MNSESAEESYEEGVPNPTLSDVRYGEHERHVLDFWKAESDIPTPLAFVIHGGGWNGGSKERMNRFADCDSLLEAGISVVSLCRGSDNHRSSFQFTLDVSQTILQVAPELSRCYELWKTSNYFRSRYL